MWARYPCRGPNDSEALSFATARFFLACLRRPFFVFPRCFSKDREVLGCFPRTGVGFLSCFPRSGEGVFGCFPRSGEGFLGSFPRSGERVFDCFPRSGEGILGCFPRNREGFLGCFPRSGEGFLGGFPKWRGVVLGGLLRELFPHLRERTGYCKVVVFTGGTEQCASRFLQLARFWEGHM